LTTSASSSLRIVEPAGSERSLAKIWKPASVDLALDVDADLDGDLLALAHLDEVDVLEEALDRVGLDLLGQGQQRLALDVDVQQRVGATVLERHHRVVPGQGDVLGVVPVAVDDRRHLVRATDASRSALAELGTGLGLDQVFRHRCLRSSCCGSRQRSWGASVPETRHAPQPVGHGAWNSCVPATSITEVQSLAEATGAV
jgi:hypothetical protein